MDSIRDDMIRVLYVDDEPASLALVKDYLEGSGDLSVDTAHSADEAMNMMASVHYDAIVSDYAMPGANGLELLQRIRERDGGMPFVLFTGRGREEVVIEACNAGVSFYVQKGTDVDAQFTDLEHKVRQAVARSEAEEALMTKKLQATMAMDLAQIASWEFDPRTEMFRFDDIFYKLLRTNAAREGGPAMTPEKYLKEFVHPDDQERVMSFIRSGVDRISPQDELQIEHRSIRRDGEVRDFVVRVKKMVDHAGNLLKVIGISWDVTGR
jgi:CheY-like chemotaxis protein